MSRYLWLLWALLCLSQAPAWGEPLSEAELTKLQVRAAVQQGADAWNRGDLDAFMTDYVQTEDLTFTAGGRVVRGYQALKERYQKAYGSSRESMGQLRFDDIEVWPLGTDYALALGKWFLLLPSQGKGIGESIEGVFSLILKRTPDGWKIMHDHTSRLEKEKDKK